MPMVAIFAGSDETRLRDCAHSDDEAVRGNARGVDSRTDDFRAAALSANCASSHTKGCCRCKRTASTPRIGQAIFIANLGIFASLIGVLLWIYLRVAVFSQDVREILLTHSLRYASVYYAFSIVLNE